jgi:hypothetical protein
MNQPATQVSVPDEVHVDRPHGSSGHTVLVVGLSIALVLALLFAIVALTRGGRGFSGAHQTH